ncbi:DUF5687 family protein [Elizabethkingia miricola]|uniref:DUF5687 family protein n=1 Tax=Elizabethkingia miricola TaxID=172045 RepID=UPI00099A45B1|nr:DUF5687 family protein [Elizabethkingia miricola]OPC08009.1 hypothetical protein BAY01_16580 [Elizabethkingia miricola]
MFAKLIRLEFKSFFRSPQLGAGILMKIGMFFIFAYMALIFFGGAFALFFGARKEGVNPLILFSRFFLVYWVVDLLLKYFMQQLPANNIKPLLTLNIPKNKITSYTLVKILLSFFTWVFLLFMLPFTVLLLVDGGFSVLSVLAIFISVVALIFSNAFINTFINKNNTLLYSIFAVIIVLVGLHYFKIIDVLNISETLIYSVYQKWWLFFIPLILVLALGKMAFSFIKQNLYLDKGLEMKKAVGKTENIEYLNRFGAIGTFINNDIKLIKRSKAARSALIGGFLFLFYGLLVFNKGYSFSFMQVFLGIFVTGGFNLMFGQRVPAWDSSYYPLMMTQNVPYKEYLKAKWWLFVIVTAVSMVLATFYVFFTSWTFYFTIFAAGLYNLGVNSYLTLLAGAYNKKPIDLNSASKGFTAGQNNFNIKILIIIIPQMLVPMAVFGIVKYFAGMSAAVISLGILGLIGFLLRDKIFDQIVKIYKSEKYSTLAAFKKVD